jgi:hypothetical protein
MTLKSLVSVHSTNTIKENPEQRKPRHTHSTRDVIVKKKYKVDLTDHNIRPYSFMLVVLQKMQKEGDFVADVAFLSSSYSDRTKDGGAVKEDIESIKESELADVIGKYPFRRFRIRGKSRIVMDIVINKDQALQSHYSNFVADVAFLSSFGMDFPGNREMEEKEDIESIKESELADLIKRYRIFVKCIKTAEQKELSRRSKNASQRINLLSVIQLIAKGMNTSHIKKSMIAKSAYLKKATASTVNVRKVISDFHELKNNSIKREIYTRINVGNTLVTTTSTIELDADIVTILQKQPEVTNLTIRNFILNIHMSNVSLSTFLLLNKVNHIFSNFGMIIGFSRMTTTPISVSNLPNLLLAPLDPFSIIGVALPMGLFIFIPRIAHLMIKYRIRNMSFSAKRNVVIGKS